MESTKTAGRIRWAAKRLNFYHTNISESFLPIFNKIQTLPPESPHPFLYPQSRTGRAYPGPLSPSSGATMSTLRQIEANRRNAQKSTGPTSVTGKATSSMNALKTGIHAESLVLPSENLADLEQLTADFYQHHQPTTPDARGLVDELIYCEWMLRRLRVAETQAWQYQSDNKYSDPQKYPLGQSATCHSTTFSKLQYRLDATRRARLRALDALQKLKTEAAAAPPTAPGADRTPPPATPPPPPTSSTASTPPAAPASAPSMPSKNSRPKPQPHPAPPRKSKPPPR